ncbi:hypothetical protein JMJ77_0009305 [Colletotrichum scovillei]|uniref:Uncharacterized protein n=1 Tax=Colletotrichum scovillei TaxID=1209932 RepID=A0A9P7U987_9PEZI|nr:hypothetical protein JMJ77_0009305 [Colletotrichum scovillei]KAG7052382.1 hypothetical protein JMJ78_0005400 [Colletotrichum scovillei]KAG7064674.1 hypothetical protein JMJ76_0012434 [Colletotrichum scovillei]
MRGSGQTVAGAVGSVYWAYDPTQEARQKGMTRESNASEHDRAPCRSRSSDHPSTDMAEIISPALCSRKLLTRAYYHQRYCSREPGASTAMS